MAAPSPRRRQQKSGYCRQVSRSTSAPRARCRSRCPAARSQPMAGIASRGPGKPGRAAPLPLPPGHVTGAPVTGVVRRAGRHVVEGGQPDVAAAVGGG